MLESENARRVPSGENAPPAASGMNSASPEPSGAEIQISARSSPRARVNASASPEGEYAGSLPVVRRCTPDPSADIE